MMQTGRRIGVVGTGIMGGHMARRLSEAGFTVTAWNRTAQKVEALKGQGVSIVQYLKVSDRTSRKLIWGRLTRRVL